MVDASEPACSHEDAGTMTQIGYSRNVKEISQFSMFIHQRLTEAQNAYTYRMYSQIRVLGRV